MSGVNSECLICAGCGGFIAYGQWVFLDGAYYHLTCNPLNSQMFSNSGESEEERLRRIVREEIERALKKPEWRGGPL